MLLSGLARKRYFLYVAYYECFHDLSNDGDDVGDGDDGCGDVIRHDDSEDDGEGDVVMMTMVIAVVMMMAMTVVMVMLMTIVTMRMVANVY